MSTPSDDRPTAVQPTVEQPMLTTAPATRRSGRWYGHIPARLGRARTSTVVIGCLFVLLFALHAMVRPDPVEYTSVVDANTGATIQVPASLVPSEPPAAPAPTTGPSSTAESTPESTSAPTTTSSRSRTTSAPRATTAEPGTTAPRSTAGSETAEPTTPEPAESAEPTSEEPAPSAAETSAAPTS